MGINHRQNRPFASDGHTRAFVRSSVPRAGSIVEFFTDATEGSLIYPSAICSLPHPTFTSSSVPCVRIFTFLYINFFLLDIHAKVSYGMVTRSCGRPQLRAGGHGAPAVFPIGKSAAIFHYPTRQCICLFRPPPATSAFPATALTLEKVSCRYLCFDTGRALRWP